MLEKLKYKNNLDETLTYMDAFWEKEVIDRPIICITAPKRGLTQIGHNVNCASVLRCKTTDDLDILLKGFEQYLETTAFLGEAMPHLNMDFGPDSYASFFGGEIFPSNDLPTTWVNPVVDRFKDFEVKIDKTKGGNFDRLLSFMRHCTAFSEGKFLMSMMDMHSNLDAMSALRGPTELCFDFMDYPEEVEEALLKFRKTHKEIFNAVFEAGNMGNRGSIGWAPTYSRGKFEVAECDFSCLISPQQGKDTFIKAIEEEANYLDNCVYHLDGKEALPHLDNILAIKKIDVIQWVPGDGQPRTIEWMDLLKKIQSWGKGIWIYDWTPEEIKLHSKELKSEGLVFSVNCESEEQGEELIEHLSKHH